MKKDRRSPAPKARPRRRGPGRWYYIFMAAVTVGTLGASTAVGLIIGYINSLPPIEDLENYDPAESTLIYDRGRNRQIGQFTRERRRIVPIDQIPAKLQSAFQAIEDERFEDHYGVDLKAVARAAVANYRHGWGTQGASTITMQLSRNVSDKVGREKKLERKLREVFLTFQIEQRYSKPQILEFYLNHIFLGHGSYGIHAAAQTYFSKPLNQLTLAECATLAAIPKAPSKDNPIADPERSRKRRDLVLRKMRALGWVTEDQYREAVNTPLQVRRGVSKSNAHQSDYPYFVDALRNELISFYRVQYNDLREQGLVIESTINTAYQEIAEQTLVEGLIDAERLWNQKKGARAVKERENFDRPAEGQTRLVKIDSVDTSRTVSVTLDGYRGSIDLPAKLPYYEPDNIIQKGNRIDVKISDVDYGGRRFQGELADTEPLQGSLVVLDAQSAEVLALVGGADFRDKDNKGQYNRAIMGGRQAGSTVKPFFYAAALAMGHGPHEIIKDEPVVYGEPPREYRPRNYEKKFFGWTTLLEGLEHSRNVVTIRMFESLGLTRALRTIKKFDPHVGDMEWKKKFRPELAMALGTVDMTPLEVAAAYLIFTNQGIKRRPRFFTKISDRGGNEVIAPRAEEESVIHPIVARQMIYMMRQVVERGTGRGPIGSRFPSPPFPPIAGKTGTTDNSTAAWFSGYTPDLIIVCSVGFDTPRTMGPKMTGGRVAGPIWAKTFERIYATRDDWTMEFDDPPGIEKIDICAVTGKRVSRVCEQYHHKIYRGVPYRKGHGPRERCDDIPSQPMIEPVGAWGDFVSDGWASGAWNAEPGLFDERPKEVPPIPRELLGPPEE